MIIKCYNEKNSHDYLLFLDIEFSKTDLVQFAGIIFKRVDTDGTFQLMRSINVYVSTQVCYPFMEYTNISNSFLKENGVPLQDAQWIILEDFLGSVNLDKLCVISHGLKNDRIVLQENGINLSNHLVEMPDKSITKPIDGYCTFTNARRILGRQNNLKLADICEECGFYLHNAHNAFNDVWAEVAVYTYLRKKEAEQEEEIK